MTRRLAVLGLAALLAACSGGGGGGSSSGGGTPQATPETEVNDTRAQANALAIGTPMRGAISAEADVDWYAFTVPAGGANVRFQTFDAGGTACDPTNGDVDPFLEIYDAAGTFVDGADDNGLQPWCEDLTVHLAAGTNYVMVGGWLPVPFDYTLKVTLP